MELELAELEPKLKELLYRCLEDVHATKAALYLLGDASDYGIATQYGFRAGLRDLVGFSDDMVDQLLVKRSAFFVNGLTKDPRFSEILYDADTTRMLVAPIYSRGKLVGFLDLRDKAGKEPFEQDDVANAQKIADEFLDLFAQRGLYGQGMPSPTNVKLPKLEQPEPESQIRSVIEDARATISRGVLKPAARAQTLTEEQFRVGAALLPGILGLSHAVLAGLTTFGAAGGFQEVVAQGEVAPDAIEQYQSRLKSWLSRRGETGRVTRTAVEYPFGLTGPQVTAVRLASLLSAPVNVRDAGGVVLSVAFETQPDQDVKVRLEQYLGSIQRAIENAIAKDVLSSATERVAEKLLEPDLDRFPALAAHSRRVAELCERLARAIGLVPGRVEQARICGLVHDVGTRLLGYGSLYRAPSLTSEQLRTLREHPVVGAAIVAESALDVEIARAVYAHHERPDGTGYPEGIAADEIPLAARIVHICEAWDAMTAGDTYQNPVDVATAIGKIRRGAGTQFDADLASRFAEMMGG